MNTYKMPAGFRSLVLALARIIIMLAVGLAIYVRVFESRLIFYPERTLAATPSTPYEDVHFIAADGTRLHGWFIPFEASGRVFLISHGNAGNIGDREVMGRARISKASIGLCTKSVA